MEVSHATTKRLESQQQLSTGCIYIPSLGHLFRLGAINLNTAQLFFRTVTVQMTVEIPLYNPAIHEEHDQRTPKEIMPAGWVFDEDEAV